MVKVGQDDAPLDAFNTVVLSSNANETGIQLTSLQDGTELVLVRLPHIYGDGLRYSLPLQIAGEPLDQPVVQYGPFVMTTAEEIQKTFLDCVFPHYVLPNNLTRCADDQCRPTREKWLREVTDMEERDRRIIGQKDASLLES